MVMKNQTSMFGTKQKRKKENNEALLNAIKFCVYPASIEDKTIDIPQDELETGRDELSVRYLISTYGFKIQSVIPGSVTKKEHFNPVMSSTKTAIPRPYTSEKQDLELPKKGQIWIDSRDNSKWYFDNVVKDIYHIKYLHSLKNDAKLSASSIQSLVNAGVLGKEKR